MSKYLNKLNELDPTRMYIISVDEYLENEKYYDSLLTASGRERFFLHTKINYIFNGNTKTKWICALFNTTEYYTWWLVESYEKPSVDEAFTQMLDYFNTYYKHCFDFISLLESYKEQHISLDDIDLRVEKYKLSLCSSFAQSFDFMYNSGLCKESKPFSYLFNKTQLKCSSFFEHLLYYLNL